MDTRSRPNDHQLDHDVYSVVSKSAQPIKPQAIRDRLSAERVVHSHEVARSIWRLVDRGRVVVRAGQGVSSTNIDEPGASSR